MASHQLERAIWLGLLGIGAALRLWDLGAAPLNAAESAAALEAWHAYRGQPVDLGAGPLYIYGTAVLFFLFGASDASARLLPAVAGASATAFPYFLRPQLGPAGATGAGVMLAVSPTLVFASRQAGNEMLAAALGLGCLAAALRYRAEPSRRWLYGSAFCLGLLLASGPAGYAVLLSLGLLLGLAAALGWASAPGVRWWPSAGERARAGALAAGLGILVSTGGLSNPPGLGGGLVEAVASWWGALASLEGAWVGRYGGLLAGYEAPAAALALLGLALCWREAARAALLAMLGWFALGLFVLALGGALGQPSAVALAAAPLAVLGGAIAGPIMNGASGERPRPVALSLFVLGSLTLVSLAGLIVSHYSLPGPPPPPLGSIPVLTFLIAPASLLIVTLYAAYHWMGGARAAYTGLVALGALLLAFYWHTSLLLNFSYPVGVGVSIAAAPASEDIRALAMEVQRHSDVLSRPGQRDLRGAVDERYRYPLAWYLREFTNITYARRLPVGAALVVATEKAELAGGRYVGRRYRIAASGPAPPADFKQLWRWFVYREYTGPLQPVDAVLFVRVSS